MENRESIGLTQTAPTLLQVDALSRRFGRRTLFSDVSFTLQGGSTIAITGSNGTGKSTLLKIMAGVLRSTRGSVSLMLDGEHVPKEEMPLRVGLAAPYLQLYDGFSPDENLRFIARTRGMSMPGERIESVLSLVGMHESRHKTMRTFSSGMLQRIRLATALIHEPPVLLLDEPYSNLDAPGRKVVDQVLDRAKRQGKITVLATNVASEAKRCDRTINIQEFA